MYNIGWICIISAGAYIIPYRTQSINGFSLSKWKSYQNSNEWFPIAIKFRFGPYGHIFRDVYIFITGEYLCRHNFSNAMRVSRQSNGSSQTNRQKREGGWDETQIWYLYPIGIKWLLFCSHMRKSSWKKAFEAWAGRHDQQKSKNINRIYIIYIYNF